MGCNGFFGGVVMDLSVIIVSYNTRELLRDCLHSLASAGAVQFEVLVVDNASADGSAEMVGQSFPDVQLIVNDHNAGFAAANNIGLRRARGRYLLLLNSDTRVLDGALARMVQFMDAHPAAGYCGPCLLNADDSHQASARRFPTPLSRAWAMSGMAGRYPRSRHALDLHWQGGAQGTYRVDWLSGACLMVRAAAVEQVGVLDESFFMYFEETDWCRRMARGGWEGWYIGDARVVHLGGGSVRHDSDVRPFQGDHPVHWVHSQRCYMRRYHGRLGLALSEGLQVAGYALVWLRHRVRGGELSRRKASTAAAAIRHLMKGPARADHP